MNDISRPTSEAEAEAEGREARATADGNATLQLAALNPKAAQQLAKAEAEARVLKAKAEADEAARKAKAEADEAALELSIREQKAKAEADREAEERTEAARQRKLKAKREAKADAQVNGLKARAFSGLKKAAQSGLNAGRKAKNEAAATYSAFLYLVAVTVAVQSQAKVITGAEPEWNTWIGLAAGLVIEGAGLAFYATSVSQRLDNRSGLAARVVAWGFTALAASMQYIAHKDTLVSGHPVIAYGLAGITVSAMLLAEIRTSFKVGKTLEDLDQKDKPLARLGWKFVLRYPSEAWYAVSVMIRSPRTYNTREKALRAARMIRVLRYRKLVNEALMREATKALKSATKAGASEAILFRINELALLGLDGVRLQAELVAPGREAKADREADEDGDVEARLASAQRMNAIGPVAQTVKAEVVAELEAKAAAKAKAEVVTKAEPKAAPAPRPRPVVPAQPKAEAKAAEAKAEAEATATGLEAAWADRPKGAEVWKDRLAELASAFPESPLPSRAKVIEYFRARKEAGEELRHAWTNKEHVGWAIKDLDDLRMAAMADPQPVTVSN